MRVTRSSASPAVYALRLVGLLAVVACLFGMHGPASHGVEGMDVVPGTALSSQSMAASLPRIGLPPVGVDGQSVTADRSQTLRSTDSGHGDMDMSIAMMCVAILGAALLGLLRLLSGGRSSWVHWARSRRPRVILPAGRGLAPPSLMDLSIQRC